MISMSGRKAATANQKGSWKQPRREGEGSASIAAALGIQEHELGRTWLSTIDSFGSVKGDTAHQSRRAAAA
jgi:hypothetical protein